MEEVEPVVLRHTAVFFVRQVDALLQQRFPPQVVQRHGQPFLAAEAEAGVGGVLLIDQGEPVAHRAVEKELIVLIQAETVPEEQTLDAYVPGQILPIVLGGAEGGFHRAPVLDAVLFKGHADVPIEGGEGELL